MRQPRTRGTNVEALRGLTSKLHAAEDLFTNAMVAGYREEQKRLLLCETSQRASMIDSLLHGRILDDWSLSGSRQRSSTTQQWSICGDRRRSFERGS